MSANKDLSTRFINFIKPLKGPDEATSLDFLERIAAICRPICEANHISVMSLEEYEPNREFLGRNFNHGEVIQLVLKARTGKWLPFRFVQMVAIHELSHCTHMNHSKAFWKLRDQYALELRELWQSNYTGDGFWSRGMSLYDGQYSPNTMPETDTIAESVCGGIYRSGGLRKRKRPKISYAERKERRIKKKFGDHGVALGSDMATRPLLEHGKVVSAKPRAKGPRGRDIRAAAALARLEQAKKETEDGSQQGTESESESEYDVEDKTNREYATDSQGKKILDGLGNAMIKICDEGDQSRDFQREAEELRDMDIDYKVKTQKPHMDVKDSTGLNYPSITSHRTRKDRQNTETVEKRQPTATAGERVGMDKETTPCPICSLANGADSLTCVACAHVLDPGKLPGSWRCQKPSCQGRQYLNAGDAALCGLCGMTGI